MTSLPYFGEKAPKVQPHAQDPGQPLWKALCSFSIQDNLNLALTHTLCELECELHCNVIMGSARAASKGCCEDQVGHFKA